MKVQRVFILTHIGTTVLQHMAADLAHGFRRLGIDVEVYRERYPDEKVNIHAAAQVFQDMVPSLQAIAEMEHKDLGKLHGLPIERFDTYDVARVLQWFKPDLVIQISHVRSERPLMWPSGPFYVSWIQDALPHLFAPIVVQGLDKDSNGKPKKRDLVLTSFPGLGERLIKEAGYPPEIVGHLPVGANCDRFYPEPFPAGEFTVAFPCHVGSPATKEHPERFNRRADPVKWLLAAGVKVKLWGKGWEVLDWAKPHWLGEVRNGPELREAYHSCHAVLQSNSDTNLHQRALEGVACGRPVLMYGLENDHHPDGILSMNLPGIYRFKNASELGDCIRRIQKREVSWTENVSIRKDHDYPARCQKILDLVNARVA